jgi:hypothetical protein
VLIRQVTLQLIEDEIMIAIVGSIEPPKATTPVHQRMTESLIAEIRPSISRGVHRAFQQLGEDADFCQAVDDQQGIQR